MNYFFQRKFMSVYVLFFFLKRRRTLKKSMKDPTFWIKTQNQEIPKFAKYIYGIPFYRKRFDEAGITPDDVKVREDFLKLPPLYKSEYRQWLLDETRDKSRFKYWMHRQTTGSSGTPLDLYSLPTDRAAEIVNLFRCALLQEKGYSPFFSRVFSTMVSNPIGKGRRFFPYHRKMSSIASPQELVKGFSEARPDFYFGNKTAVLALSRWSLDHDIPLHKPLCIGSISELLDDSARAIVERAFGPGVLFDIYGCAETGNFAADRITEPKKRVVWNDTHCVNLLNAREVPNKPGTKVGELSLTSLVHRGFPLVNYVVGDTVEMLVENGVPYIVNIIGRSNDSIKNADGTSFEWMHVNRIMFGLTDVAQFRVIQESYSDLTFILATREASNERKAEIERIVKERTIAFFGSPGIKNGKNVRVEWVEEIPPDPTGKIRILISRIN